MKRIQTIAAIVAAATSSTIIAQPRSQLVDSNSDRSLHVSVHNTTQIPLDVPYLPTPEVVVTEMLKFAAVTKTDVVYDLGCGDGRVVISAARDFGASAVGIDLDGRRIREAGAAAQRAGITDRVKFQRQDFFETDLRSATVVTMFLLPHVNLRLQPKLFSELAPGTRIVSHMFGIGGWQAERILRVNLPGGGTRTVLGWTVTGVREQTSQRKTASPVGGNLIEELGAAGNFKTLLMAIKSNGGLFDRLTGPGPYTIFAPTDEAFAKLPPATLKALISAPEKMQKLLLSHIIPGKLSQADAHARAASSAKSNRQQQTLGDSAIEFVNDASATAGKLSVRSNGVGARIVGDEVPARNGLIYPIDTVLPPNLDAPMPQSR